VPHAYHFDYLGLHFESVDYSIRRNSYLTDVPLIELSDNSPNARVVLKHPDSGKNSVAEMFRPLRAIL